MRLVTLVAPNPAPTLTPVATLLQPGRFWDSALELSVQGQNTVVAVIDSGVNRKSCYFQDSTELDDHVSSGEERSDDAGKDALTEK